MSSDKRRPWSKFYWADWTGDRKLRSCGLAARGLWMEMLAVMHEAIPYGHLLMGGKPLTTQQLANQAGCSLKECERAIAELESASVFSRTDEGVIFSRRMVRDHAKSEQGRSDVSKRWPETHAPNRPPTAHPSRSPNRVGHSPPTETPITPEARSQKPELPTSGPLPGARPPIARGFSETDLRDVLRETVEAAGFSAIELPRKLEQIWQWYEAGCHPELDVLETIKRLMRQRNGAAPGTLKYFTDAIHRARDERLKRESEAA